MIKHIFHFIFSSKNINNHKVITIFGLKFKFKKQKQISEQFIIDTVRAECDRAILGFQRCLSISECHKQTFLPFKNCNQGKTVVMIAGGPTINYFEPIKGAVYLGLNRAFKYDKVKFDYLFAIDRGGMTDNMEGFVEYEGNNCIKFIGDQNHLPHYQISESVALRTKNCLRYKTNANLSPNRLVYDIATEPLGQYCTVSLHAMQFILYTNPAKVYIVGMDCTAGTSGHFEGKTYGDIEKIKRNDNLTIGYYKEFIPFVEKYYPETEIISVNPVRLKGIFKDVYTDSYLKAIENNEV